MKFVYWTVGALVVLYALLATLTVIFQRDMIYFPDHNVPAAPPPIQELRIQTSDRLNLLAWYLPPRDDGAPVVLYLHGNGGNIAYRGERLRRFARLGWGVLMPEYRGYGGNPGSPSETGLKIDARAAWDTLATMGIPERRVVLWGESLGTGLAVPLATQVQPAAVLLESPYTSMTDLARWHMVWAPYWLLRDTYQSISVMPQVRAPVFIMQGGRDGLVPPAMGVRLRDVTTAPVELWNVPQAGHNDLAEHGAIERAATFVRGHTPLQ